MGETAVLAIGKSVVLVSGFSMVMSRIYSDENIVMSIIVGIVAGIVSFADYYHELTEEDRERFSSYYRVMGAVKSILLSMFIALLTINIAFLIFDKMGMERDGTAISISWALAGIFSYFHRQVIPLLMGIFQKFIKGKE